jgi:hypothetical protein
MKYCVSCRWSSGRERNRCQYREWRCESKRGVVDGGPRTDEIPTREVFIGLQTNFKLGACLGPKGLQ